MPTSSGYVGTPLELLAVATVAGGWLAYVLFRKPPRS